MGSRVRHVSQLLGLATATALCALLSGARTAWLTLTEEDDEGTPDQTELSEVRWFTRAEARQLLAGEIDATFAPGPLAIAHQLIRAWAEE